MAASMMRCCLRAVSVQCPSPIFTRIGKHSAVVPAFANLLISNRPYASEKKSSKKKGKKKTATPEPLYKKKRYEGELPSGPTDDVYLTWCYQRPIYEAEVAVDMLKSFQELDFTSPRQFVYADITLDMSMDKKKPVDPFTATLLLPHRFLDNTHKVLVFTENADEAIIAKEHGAEFVGGYDLVKPGNAGRHFRVRNAIFLQASLARDPGGFLSPSGHGRVVERIKKKNSMSHELFGREFFKNELMNFKNGLIANGEIQADFYVCVPAMLSKLNSLRSVLKDKYPKSKNGSASYDIPKMLSFFKVCHEYKVGSENKIQSWFARLDMPNDHIVANLDALIKDVCKYRPLSYGPFVKRLVIRSATSEGLPLKFERFLPAGALKGKEEKEGKEEANEADETDDEGEMQESQ